MSTFEDWLEGCKHDPDSPFTADLVAIKDVQAKRKEMVCANCEHFVWSTGTAHQCSKHGIAIRDTDFYCKSFTMKGEE